MPDEDYDEPSEYFPMEDLDWCEDMIAAQAEREAAMDSEPLTEEDLEWIAKGHCPWCACAMAPAPRLIDRECEVCHRTF